VTSYQDYELTSPSERQRNYLQVKSLEDAADYLHSQLKQNFLE